MKIKQMYKFKKWISSSEMADVMRIIKYNKKGLICEEIYNAYPDLQAYFEKAPKVCNGYTDWMNGVEPIVRSHIRKLIEMVGDEIIGKDDECRFDALSDPDTIIDKNDLREEQRLKVKEIINSLK